MRFPDVYAADDIAFDAVYPSRIRSLSPRFWTPVDVARQAAALLRRAGARRVLDVGAGVGKFVLVAASEEPELDLVGVEQRAHLVEIAKSAHLKLGLANASFHVGDVTTLSWEGFDAFYFYNPLAENLYSEGGRIDDQVELNKKRFVRDALRVERSLRAAPLGSLALTYHGVSGRIPACYEIEASEPAGSDWLRLWAKRHEKDDGAFFLEVDDGTVLLQRGALAGLAW